MTQFPLVPVALSGELYDAFAGGSEDEEEGESEREHFSLDSDDEDDDDERGQTRTEKQGSRLLGDGRWSPRWAEKSW